MPSDLPWLWRLNRPRVAVRPDGISVPGYRRAVRSWLPLVGLLVAVLILAAHSASLQPWTLDDAYITFRYAENLAQGHGPVYNPGERVEGYTTPLWMALVSIGQVLGVALDPWAKALGVTAAVGALAVLVAPSEDIPLDERGRTAAVLTLGSCGMFTGWVMSGMEVALVVLLSTCAWGAHLRRWPIATGVLGALATATRPDGVLMVAVQLAHRVANRQWPELARQIGAFGLLYGPFFAWRWSWYGWLLPNTFYAKVGATSDQVVRGVGYVLEFSWPAAPLLLAVVAALALGRRSAWLWGPLAWFAVHSAYVVAVGGDVMPAFRFFAPTLPVLAWATAACIQSLAQRWARGWTAVAGALVAFQIGQLATHDALRRRILQGNVGRNGREVGLWLREQVPPGTWLATNTAGSVPYFSGLPTIDMLGLNDSHIAHTEAPAMGRGKAGHEKADGAYVFSRRPDLVLFGAARGKARPGFRSDRELFRQPGFKTAYRPETYRLPSGTVVHLWRHVDAPSLVDTPVP